VAIVTIEQERRGKKKKGKANCHTKFWKKPLAQTMDKFSGLDVCVFVNGGKKIFWTRDMTKRRGEDIGVPSSYSRRPGF
jgi:hypothetical protein